MTFKVQERVIWNFSIWGKYFSALFFYYFPLKFCQICFFVQLAELFNFGEVFLPHLYHICEGWGFLLTSDSFVEEFSLNFCIKIISVWTNLLLFWTFIPHICHIYEGNFAAREFSRVFFLFYSGTVVSSTLEQFEELFNLLPWLNVSVFILVILLLLKQIPLAVVIVAIFLLKWDLSLSDGLHVPACLRWKSNFWTVAVLLYWRRGCHLHPANGKDS